ncbi:MAG: sulfotransferase [Gelidibacter sp.]
MKKLILVTGAHRSGSTWTGKVISQSKDVRYVQEPFNIAIKKYKSPIKYWFQFVDKNQDKEFQLTIKSYLKSFFSISIFKGYQNLSEVKSLKSLYTYFLELHRKKLKRTLIKDPIALMSAPWIYDTFPSDVVVTVRHPAAFVASMKLKSWEFNFNELLQQKDLMTLHLKKFQTEIEFYSRKKQSILEQGILLWNILYSVILQYQKTYGNKWYFIKHEDLSLNPINEFSKIFDFLNLPFTEEIQSYIIATTTSKEEGVHVRDSKSNIHTWKDRLSSDEIDQIKTSTKTIWVNYYDESDW